MSIASLFKIEKLKITAYKDPARRRKITGLSEFEAMFNPASFQQTYKIHYGNKERQGFNASGQQVAYARTKPEELSLTLLLDGTGVDQMGVFAIAAAIRKNKTVAQQVQDFLKVAFRYNGDIHEPNYLKVSWGSLVFSCRLEKVDVKYTLFGRDGKPLRAELTVNLLSDIEAKRRQKEENKTSPDLTHSRVVKSGDSLPLLTHEIYGSSDYYLRVARFNRLDDFRRLTPGLQLIFPPLESLPAAD